MNGRSTRTLLLAAILGLATTTGLAWRDALEFGRPTGPAWIGRRARDPARAEGRGEIYIHRRPSRERTIYEVQIVNSPAEGTGREPPPEAGVPWGERRAALPWTVGAAPWPEPDPLHPHQLDPPRMTRKVHTLGRPWRALWFEYAWVPEGPGWVPRARGGIVIPRSRLIDPADISWNGAYLPAVLPTRILWPGFLADSLVFGAGWLALLAGPGFAIRFVRRALRRRAGRCERCAYDLRGLPRDAPCPECGRPTRPAALSDPQPPPRAPA